MLRARVMPCLLVENGRLVKTVAFKNPSYVGDPVNAIKIFNEKEVDELILLDIAATVEGTRPSLNLLSDVCSECFMPLSYGGGITDLGMMAEIYALGIEKIVINTHAIENPRFVASASERFGSQSVVVSIDAKRKAWGRGYVVYTHGGRRPTKLDPTNAARKMEEMGAGEVLLNSIDHDGTMEGYDLSLIRQVAESLSIPLVACGGAGQVNDIEDAIHKGGASAAAVGSLAVYQGKNRGVLINFPTPEELRNAIL
jgi:cyclase